MNDIEKSKKILIAEDDPVPAGCSSPFSGNGVMT